MEHTMNYTLKYVLECTFKKIYTLKIFERSIYVWRRHIIL